VVRINKILKFLSVAVISITIACSPKISNNLLTFFFDGVPPADSAKAESSAEMQENETNSEVFRSVPVEVRSVYSAHYPYTENECFSCHDEKSKSDLVMPEPDLCYTCHSDYSTEYKYVHGPVAGGYCTVCHNPHMSKNLKLLVRPGGSLCLDCHQSQSVFKNEVHSQIADNECITCHNPHGGSDRFILN
jgi:predicted CXXCH cytochrome family protein